MRSTVFVINPNSTEAGRRLRDERQAQVIVMGCAGMAGYRAPLQRALGMPVVEPSQAAVVMALGRVRLDWESAAVVNAASESAL